MVSATTRCSICPAVAGFICESFAFEVPAPGFALAAFGLSHIAPTPAGAQLKNEDFSRDQTVEALKNDPLTPREVQPAMHRRGVGERRRSAARRIRADHAAAADHARHRRQGDHGHGSQFFHDMAGSQDMTLKLYEGHYHDLLDDLGKEQVMADIRAWINARPRGDIDMNTITTNEGATIFYKDWGPRSGQPLVFITAGR